MGNAPRAKNFKKLVVHGVQWTPKVKKGQKPPRQKSKSAPLWI